MAQYDIDIRDYWRIIKKRRKIILFSMVTMAVFSFVFAKLKARSAVDFYASSAQIKIDKAVSGEDMYMRSFGMGGGSDDVDTDVITITSFKVMAEVARRFDEDVPESASDDDIQKDPDLTSRVNYLTSLITAERSEFTNVVVISTMSYDPEDARDLAQYTALTYQDYRKNENNKQVDKTIEFLEDEIKKNNEKIAASKISLNAFITENDSLMPYFAGEIILGELAANYRQQNAIEARELPLKSMIKLIKEKGTIDDSSISSVFADQEGSVFRNNYSKLLLNMEQRKKLLELFTPEHPEVKTLDNRIESTRQTLLDQLIGSRNHLENQKQALADVAKNLRNTNLKVNTKSDELELLQAEATGLTLKAEELYQQYSAVQLKKSENVEEVSIITPAIVNETPVNKAASTTTVTFVGIFLGLVIGLVFGFVFEALDTSIGTIEDVEEYLGLPVIGLIPQMELSQLKDRYSSYKSDTKSKKAKDQEDDTIDDEISSVHARLVIKYAPKSPLAESYRALRTNIQFISFEKEAKVLMFSSSSPGEGKTTTIVNLALTMAQSGNRVLLIDSDMRKPRLNQIFGLEKERGLSEVILGNFPWRECVKTVTDIITGELGMTDIVLTPGIDNLHIMTCGTIPPNPSELLNSEAMDEFLSEARNEYDMILFDCTPILPTTDPAVLGRKVDGSVLVYAVGRVSRGSLKRAKAQLDNVKARLVGVILNGMRADSSADYPEYKYSEAYYGVEEGDQLPETKAEKIKNALGGFLGKLSS